MKLHQIFFGLLVLFLPTQLGYHFWPDFTKIMGIRVDYLSPTLYLTDILALFLFIFAVKNGFFKKLRLKTKFFGLYFVFLVLNCFFASNQEVALFKLLKIIELSFIGLYVSFFPETRQSIKRLLPISLVFVVFLAIFQFLQQSSVGGLFWFFGERIFDSQTPGIALENLNGSLFLRPYSTFSHPNSLAGFLLVGSILTYPLAAYKKFNFYYLLLITFGLILTWSYAVWMAGILLLFVFLINKTKRVKTPVLYLTFFSFVVCSLFLLFLAFPQFSSEVVQERLKLILASFKMISTDFLFGVGLNNFLVELPKLWTILSFRLLQPVHSLYLLVLVETGFIGSLFFLYFIFKTIKNNLADKQRVPLVALITILFLGLFDHYWLTLQQNLFLFSLVVGLSWQETCQKE